MISHLTKNTKGVRTAGGLGAGKSCKDPQKSRLRTQQMAADPTSPSQTPSGGLHFSHLGYDICRHSCLVHGHTQCSAHLTPPPSHPIHSQLHVCTPDSEGKPLPCLVSTCIQMAQLSGTGRRQAFQGTTSQENKWEALSTLPGCEGSKEGIQGIPW